MKEIAFPYGKEKLTYNFDERELAGVLTFAHSTEHTIEIAKNLLGKQNPTITAIPDGVSVVVQK